MIRWTGNCWLSNSPNMEMDNKKTIIHCQWGLLESELLAVKVLFCSNANVNVFCWREKHSSSSAAYEMYSTPNIIGLWSRQWFRARVLILVQLPSVEPFIPVSPPHQPLQVGPLSCVPLSDLLHFVKSFRLVLGCKSEAQQLLPQHLKAPLSHSALYNTF